MIGRVPEELIGEAFSRHRPFPGSFFGEIGAFARHRRSAAVIAVDDCKLLQINALLFKDLDATLQLKMMQVVIQKLSKLVISLDNELVRLTDGKGESPARPSVCPLCNYDNESPIDVCPRCGEIPAPQY